MMVLLVSLSACSGAKKDSDELDDVPAEEIYSRAETAMEAGEFVEAADLYNEVERLYPYSEFASKSQLKAAQAYYDDQEYDEAIIALDRYIQLYPGNDDLAYAYYLRAVCFYDQITDVARDQAMTEDALQNLELLINRFPDSEYSKDARLKRDLTYDHLAGKEMEIGRYYLTRGYYQAGLNRFLAVIRKYQTTTHVPEAMHRLVESYLALGLDQEAYRIAVVLGHNYPGSEWYADTYRLLDPIQRQKLLADRTFVDKTIETIFRPK